MGARRQRTLLTRPQMTALNQSVGRRLPHMATEGRGG